MPAETEILKRQFAETFKPAGRVHVIRAPGRVNLIGEHTDYNDGFVLPMAIEPQVTIVCAARDDGKVRLSSTAFPGAVAEFSIDGTITVGEPKWTNYTRGIAAELKAAGIPLIGLDLLISNTLPVGGGLSSSAAIEVGTALCFLKSAGLDMDPMRVALISQKAEHEYAGVPCGIMDQTIVAGGKIGHAMLLDCRDHHRTYVTIDPTDLRVVIVNTMVHHSLADGEYAKRRAECEKGVAHFRKTNPDIKALRDVTPEQVEAAKADLGDLVYRRCRHVVAENIRTTESAALLGKRRYDAVGQHMYASHNSLRDDYEVSCKELDFLVAEAAKVDGVYGARMTGGGFGGCIVALVQPRAVDELSSHLTTTYQKAHNKTPGIYVTTATAGASVLE